MSAPLESPSPQVAQELSARFGDLADAFLKAAHAVMADRAWFVEDDAYMEGHSGANKRSLWDAMNPQAGVGTLNAPRRLEPPRDLSGML